ncbi:TonB-dependent receptor plug domain-containing protein [Flavobacterium alkalisoli]|uniref:TonB-dependent receptor plug domain-containing protein n=1 Tax=Flavobacterium alkalisoli TaxID=2602769 RepID=UPI003A904283
MFNKRFLFFILFLFPILCAAQDDRKKPLSEILDAIGREYNISFNKIDEELIVYRISPPDSKLSLSEKLKYIEKHTRLRIEAVNDKYYSVFNDVGMDKPLCGYLLDKETGQGIENAQISIEGSTTSLASGINGFFSIPELTPNLISINHLGYEPKIINPQDLYVSDCPKIFLTPIILQLNEVIAERYLTLGITKKEFGELVLKPRKFGLLPGLTEPDVLQTMLQIPGIASIDETVSNISVRGGTHDQNLFLWNGIRIYQTGHFFGLISPFNPLPSTSITIYKNGTSAFYGESVSSTVDITSSTPFAPGFYTAFNADMISASFFTKVNIDTKSDIQVSGRRSYTDVLETPTYKSYRERVFQNTTITDLAQNSDLPVKSDDNFYFYDFSLQYNRQIDSLHTLTVNGIGIHNFLEIKQKTPVAQREVHLIQQNFGASIAFNSDWNLKHKSFVKGNFSWYDVEAENEAIENYQETFQKNRIFTKDLSVGYTFSGSQQFGVAVGYEINETSIINLDRINDPEFSKRSKEVNVTNSGVAEVQFKSKYSDIYTKVGVRVNSYSKTGKIITEPRLSLGKLLNEKFRIELLGERKSQSMSQIIDLQQDFLGIEKRRWVLANDTETPLQISWQSSVALTYNYKDLLLTIEPFYKKTEGISSNSQGFQNQFEFLDTTGSYTVFGGEFLFQKKIWRFYNWLSYTYNNNEYNFIGYVPPQFRNNYSISNAISAATVYEWNNYKIGIGCKWHTGKVVTEPDGYNIDTENPANSIIEYKYPNSKELNDYFQVNLSFSKNWKIGKSDFSLNGAVTNLLNRQNILNRYYRINKQNNNIESVNIYSIGFTPNLGLKLIL